MADMSPAEPGRVSCPLRSRNVTLRGKGSVGETCGFPREGGLRRPPKHALHAHRQAHVALDLELAAHEGRRRVELDRGVRVARLVRLEVVRHRLDHLAGCELVVHAVLHTMTPRGMRRASSYTGPMTTRRDELELHELRPNLWELRL